MTTTSSTTTPNTAGAHTIFRAEGFSCPSCVAKIEKQVGRLPGVSNVEVKFASGRVEVDHDPSATPAEAIIAAIREAGYTATVSAF